MAEPPYIGLRVIPIQPGHRVIARNIGHDLGNTRRPTGNGLPVRILLGRRPLGQCQLGCRHGQRPGQGNQQAWAFPVDEGQLRAKWRAHEQVTIAFKICYRRADQRVTGGKLHQGGADVTIRKLRTGRGHMRLAQVMDLGHDFQNWTS